MQEYLQALKTPGFFFLRILDLWGVLMTGYGHLR